MKILHLLASNKFSGAENVVCQIIGMFKNNENMQMVYCSCDGQVREALNERNINFAPIKTLNVKEVKRIIQEQKPDVIHAHDMRASFVAAQACGKISLISHIHNNAFNSRGISLKSILYAFAAKKAKQIFWVSQSSFHGYAFHKKFQKKSTVLYNIIDIEALYQKMQEDDNTYDYDIIYLGRLTYPKNPQRLIEVLSKVVKKKNDIKVAIVGTGDLEAETKRLVEELEIEQNVDFLGFQSNPLKILHDSKVMVMTSRWEGTPMCALEAMALGVPIVSTPTDGLCDLIEEEKDGYLSDDDEILSERIAFIVNNPDIHKELSFNAINKARKINDIKNYKAELEKVYQNK